MNGRAAKAPCLAGCDPRGAERVWYARRAMKRVRVNVSPHPYDVVVGEDALRKHPLTRVFGPGAHGVVISSRPVMDRHGDVLRGALAAVGMDVRAVILLPDGEKAKTVREWERSLRALARTRVDRSGFVVAFGGGSVGDAAGFVAASYMRGIRTVQIPTTLLSMVDSSVGGKTGLNLVEGKNLVGAFHQPSLVLADLRFLKTLPERERRSGVYEILKCGLLRSEPLVKLVERTRGLSRASSAELEQAVALSIRIKARIVEADERESGERVLLNLGHTLGHGLEAATAYRVFTHGEAVGHGMKFSVDLGERLGITPRAAARRMREAIESVGPRTALPKALASRAAAATLHDKKRLGADLKEVLLERPGRPVVHRMAANDFAAEARHWLSRSKEA